MTLRSEEVRAWEQLARRKTNPPDGGTQRVAQWEIDGWYSLVQRYLTIIAEPGADVGRDGIVLAWSRYRELLADSQRLTQLERWLKEPNNGTVILKPSVTGLIDLQVGDGAVVCPGLREGIDIHVRAGK